MEGWNLRLLAVRYLPSSAIQCLLLSTDAHDATTDENEDDLGLEKSKYDKCSSVHVPTAARSLYRYPTGTTFISSFRE